MRNACAYLLGAALVICSCIKERPTGADLGVGNIIPDCGKVLPVIQELYDKYAHDGVAFALISREDGEVYICEKGGLIKAIYSDDPVPGFEELDSQINSLKCRAYLEK